MVHGIMHAAGGERCTVYMSHIQRPRVLYRSFYTYSVLIVRTDDQNIRRRRQQRLSPPPRFLVYMTVKYRKEKKKKRHGVRRPTSRSYFLAGRRRSLIPRALLLRQLQRGHSFASSQQILKKLRLSPDHGRPLLCKQTIYIYENSTAGRCKKPGARPRRAEEKKSIRVRGTTNSRQSSRRCQQRMGARETTEEKNDDPLEGGSRSSIRSSLCSSWEHIRVYRCLL